MTVTQQQLNKKYRALERYLANLPPFAVAFSGGVDSTFLLAAAVRAADSRVTAVSVDSQFVPKQEVESAAELADMIGVKHICLTVDIIENSDVIRNDARRCYYCKKTIFSRIRKAAGENGIETLLHGVNLDDLKDYRPGLKAAQELGFLSPLADVELNKADIRQLSRQIGLPTWDKPSQSCLVTRIPYHDTVSREKLKRIETAEKFLQDLGFVQVRVRCHGNMARIEVEPEMIQKITGEKISKAVSSQFKTIGFDIISIDMDGYRTGKMNNEILRSKTGTDICNPS